jgi:hypothetical protein
VAILALPIGFADVLLSDCIGYSAEFDNMRYYLNADITSCIGNLWSNAGYLNQEIDCQGHTINITTATEGIIYGGHTIHNCNFVVSTGWTLVFDSTDTADIHNNTITCYDDCTALRTSNFMYNTNFHDNTITDLGGSSHLLESQNTANIDNVSSNHIIGNDQLYLILFGGGYFQYFYNNNISSYTNVFSNEYGTLNLSEQIAFGNWYENFHCNDTNVDGFCDEQFYESFTEPVYDSFALYNPAEETGCTPNWVASLWSSCATNGTALVQTRSYSDLNVCGTNEGKPANEARTCGKSNNHYGRTTDFSQVADPTNVANAVVETPYGYIMWKNPINVANTNLDLYVIITPDLLWVNKDHLHPSLNSTANVSFRMLGFGDQCGRGFELYYSTEAFSDIKLLARLIGEGKAFKVADKSRIGMDCFNTAICKNVQCSNNVVYFEAQHFTGYALVADYTSDDLAPIVIDGLGKFGVVIISFVSLIAIGLLYTWARPRVK